MKSVLRVLFLMAREDIHADTALLCDALRMSSDQLGRQLASLEREGLVDAARLRLTLPGLAIAVSLDALESETTDPREREREARERVRAA